MAYVLDGLSEDERRGCEFSKPHGLDVLSFCETEQEIRDEGCVDLQFDSVFGAPGEAPDLEVLLDPPEQEFDLPALAIETGDVAGGAGEVVGNDLHKLAIVAPDGEPPYVDVEGPAPGIFAPVTYDLVSSDVGIFGRVDVIQANGFEGGIDLWPGGEDGARVMDFLPQTQGAVALVEDIDRPRADSDGVCEGDVIGIRRRDAGNLRDVRFRIMNSSAAWRL